MVSRRKCILAGTSSIIWPLSGCMDSNSDQGGVEIESDNDNDVDPPPGEGDSDNNNDDDGRPPEPDPIESPVEAQDVYPEHRERTEAENSIKKDISYEYEVKSDNIFEEYNTQSSSSSLVDAGNLRLYTLKYDSYRSATVKTTDGSTYTRVEEDGSVSYPEPECYRVSDKYLYSPFYVDDFDFDLLLNSVGYTHRKTEWDGDHWISEYKSRILLN